MQSRLLNSASRVIRRLGAVGLTLVTCDFRRIGYSLWLKRHDIDCETVRWSAEKACLHIYSGGPNLESVLRALNIPRGSVALDLGSGKGVAALTLARHFASVIGVELSPDLTAIAKSNAEKAKVPNVVQICADARTLGAEIDQVTYVYMFNPFPSFVMKPAIESLKASQMRNPRKLTIIYNNPVCHEDLVAAGFKHTKDIKMFRDYLYSIYESD